MKNITLVLTSIILPILIVSVIPAYGEKFHKQGREIEILWKQKHDRLLMWGKITGGKDSCQQMNLQVYFKNSESGQSASISTMIKKFRPIGRNNYKGEKEIYIPRNKEFLVKASRYRWFVKNYYIECLN